MSLKTLIQNSVDIAFNVVSDLTTVVTLRQKGAATYDPSTGVVTSAETDTTISVIVDKYDAAEVDNQIIQANDLKILVNQSDVTTDIAHEDKIIIGTDSYKIMNISKDPAEATYELQIRKIK